MFPAKLHGWNEVMRESIVIFLTYRYGKRSTSEDVMAELLFGDDTEHKQRSRWESFL